MTNIPPDYPRRDLGDDDIGADLGQPADASWPPSADSSPSTTDVAKDEAASVKDTAVSAGQDVAATAKDEAANVATETKDQVKGLLGSVSSEVQSQAGSQQQKVAASVHSLSKELGGMASGSSESGPLTDLAHQASQKGGELAHWLDSHEPRDVLREVQSFARRRPVAFLALCGLAGVVAGRLTRGAVAANTNVDSPSADTSHRSLEADVRTGRSASLMEELPTSYETSSVVDGGVVGPASVTTGEPDHGVPNGGYGSSVPSYETAQPGDRAGGVR